jgi:hypothetical protein
VEIALNFSGSGTPTRIKVGTFWQLMRLFWHSENEKLILQFDIRFFQEVNLFYAEQIKIHQPNPKWVKARGQEHLHMQPVRLSNIYKEY